MRKPFYDDPNSRLYVSEWSKQVWVASAALLYVACAFLSGVGIVPEWLQEAVGIFFALPTAIWAFIHKPQPVSIPEVVAQARSGETNEMLTNVMRAAYAVLHPVESDRLRLTLFIPDFQRLSLYQVARYSWDGTAVPSATTVRMGTGDVGQAFTSTNMIRIDNTDELGGFAAALANFGVEAVEAEAHVDQTRKSFYALPLVDRTHGERLGVLSLDAAVPGYFSQKADRIASLAPLLHRLPTILRDLGVQGK